MHPVTSWESLTSSHSCSSDTHTVPRGQRSTAKTENKMECFTLWRTASTQQARTGRAPDLNSYLSSGLGRSASQGQLRLWLPFTRQLSGAQARIFHPSTGLSSSTQEALRVYKAGSRSASSVNKGDRSGSGTVIAFICGRYVLSTNGSQLFISSHWLFRASEDLVSLSIFTSTKINNRQSGVSKLSMDLEPGPWWL